MASTLLLQPRGRKKNKVSIERVIHSPFAPGGKLVDAVPEKGFFFCSNDRKAMHFRCHATGKSEIDLSLGLNFHGGEQSKQEVQKAFPYEGCTQLCHPQHGCTNPLRKRGTKAKTFVHRVGRPGDPSLLAQKIFALPFIILKKNSLEIPHAG